MEFRMNRRRIDANADALEICALRDPETSQPIVISVSLTVVRAKIQSDLQI